MTQRRNAPFIVLVSASPRRRAILERLGFDVRVAPADVAEDEIPYSSPRELALKAAYAKLEARAPDFPGSILVASDTVVALDGRVYGKPRDAADAAAMLRDLSGRRHSVISGVAVKGTPSSVLLDAVETYVTFRPVTEEEIARYVATGEPMDKAGAYAIQGGAREFVTGVEGDYWNVVGLPAARLLDLLGEFMDVAGQRQNLTTLKEGEI
jgi:septum formation protein